MVYCGTPTDTCIAIARGRERDSMAVDDHADDVPHRQDVRTNRDSDAAGRDLTTSLYSVAGLMILPMSLGGSAALTCWPLILLRSGRLRRPHSRTVTASSPA